MSLLLGLAFCVIPLQGQRTWVVHRTPGDTLGDSYRVHEPAGRPRSLLVLLPGGGNAGLLARTPIRLYTEPDVHWWMENRNLDYHAMNAVDHAAMINLLRVAGNTRAELITTTGKGVRPNGARHPHSWSIVDESELAGWITQVLGASSAESTAAADGRPE